MMSLKAVFLIFMDFDLFRNIGLVHQGYFKCRNVSSSIYSFRIRHQSSNKGQILFYDSSPCIKSNFRDNTYVRFLLRIVYAVV